MSQTQIRLTRTPDINKVLAFLRSKYRLLSEAEIIKVALSEKYNQEVKENEEPSKYLLSSLKQSDEDIKAGRLISFKNGRDVFTYLDREIENEKHKKHTH